MKKAQRRKVVIAVALVLAGTPAALGQKQSASRDQRSSVEQTIRQLDKERIQAQIDANARVLDRLYADDVIGVGPSGTVITKPQVISDFKPGDLSFSQSRPPKSKCAFTKTRWWRLASRQWLGKTKARPFPKIRGLPGYG